MLKKALSAAALLLLSTTTGAETLDLNVSSDAVRAALSGPLSFGQRDNARYDLGYLYSDKRDARLNIGHAALMVSGDAGARNADVQVGLGLRAAGIDQRGGSGGAVAVGGDFDLRLPDFNRIGLVGYAFYAPSVLSFGDIERFIDAAITLDYEIIRDASVYAGVRQVRVEVEDIPGSDLRDNSAIVGLRLNF